MASKARRERQRENRRKGRYEEKQCKLSTESKLDYLGYRTSCNYTELSYRMPGSAFSNFK